MHRFCIVHLEKWLTSKDRKPIVLRGARQVGKTWLVRRLAEKMGKQLIELNFERQPELSSLFNTNDPQQILINIEASQNITIDVDNSILFLDEIQATPELLAKLRWFAEDLAELPVIAAGSLLEFVLADHVFSMPVGRINYFYLEPLSFEEFLIAKKKDKLYEYLTHYQINDTVPDLIHQQLMDFLKEYMIIGGLPASVTKWCDVASLESVHQVHHDLLATYLDDFAKYSGRVSVERLKEVMRAVPKLLGGKFVYRQVNKDIQTASIKHALELLVQAKICHVVQSTAANGLPLSSEKNEKIFKAIFLDVGLVGSNLGLNLHQIINIKDINIINQGAISEQIVGQLLRTVNPFYIDPELFYWTREKKGSEAEVDYLIQHNTCLIPIEVKSGASGSLKSLHLLMENKKLSHAVRINSDYPSQVTINSTTSQNKKVSYQLLSLPFYLLGQIHRLLNHWI